MLYITRHEDAAPLHLIGHLCLFLDALVQSSATRREAKWNPLKDFYIQEAIHYIEQNYQRDITVEEVASTCRLNRNYFSKLFKEKMGCPPQEFRACTARGEHPYLPVLSDFLSTDRVNRNTDRGLLEIPTEFIVGTFTGGRSGSFARNFMPLLEEGSEFAQKWQALCRSHVEEGIREPVKVYEYMNRYYVQEGNKRVSVLKYFGADILYAQVRSIPPEENGTREVALYRELAGVWPVQRGEFCRIYKAGQLRPPAGAAGQGARREVDRGRAAGILSRVLLFPPGLRSRGRRKYRCRRRRRPLR